MAENQESKQANVQSTAPKPQAAKPKPKAPPEKKVVRSKKNRPAPVVYCGPNYPPLGLKQFAIYRGTLPKRIQRMTDGNDAMKAMFVKPQDLARTRQKLSQQGSRENSQFIKVEKYLTEEVSS